MIDFLEGVKEWLVGFFGLPALLKLLQTNDYSQFMSWNGISALMGPLIPFLLVFEIIRMAFYRRFKVVDYRISFFSLVINSFIGRIISIGMVSICIGLFGKYAIFKTEITWYWLIYGYVIWEFGHFIYHFLAHKVRLFWCLHSTHHAPETMNLSVNFAHFFLEAPYADLIRTTTCILLGVSPALLFLIMFIDGFWGSFIHIGENISKDGRFGFLNKIILTPSHHRVHHAKNALYMDTNFCNLLPIWDHVFKTYQEEDKTIKIEYGITREMKKNSFLDAYFGEIVLLAKDVWRAPGIKNKFLYIFMPPGWSHTKDHKTAKIVRSEYLKNYKTEMLNS
ncbi:hypothetical protein SRABI27_04447 [Pedobacter sp. Bi27]|uniref:sterol desaturase family protein n=1 Tax=unclassified Pedobacter TaxID=2628915 RepID=UPI001D51A158|nr:MULTISPECIES: sterol desaturase family protein [unclassified Pedobacter]CAH0299091.1 hypothetical protein SRABI36_04571 [Pedobacter sp. Bi36]CAH0302544.1 hypothetical protein SRABI27_04447 [Pedobacter sp. Bi27]CAH0309324.1 hypothetical protein SRABI126_04692 [Pedobacter sp. Bi126]